MQDLETNNTIMYLPYKLKRMTYLRFPLIKWFCFALTLVIFSHKTRGIKKHHRMICQSKFIIQRAKMRSVPLECIARESRLILYSVETDEGKCSR